MFNMLIGEKIKEKSTAISYHEEKRSEKFTSSGSGDFYIPKWEITQYKVENGIQLSKEIVFFFASPKIRAVKSSGCRAFRDTAEKEELINLMLTMEEHLRHLKRDPWR